MATILSNEQMGVGGLRSNSWKGFSESERQQMQRDDIQAGVTVSMILTGVILAGLVIGLVGVMLSL